ncbi:hypothetical protein GLUCORHAEAF1_13290 [Komagataeibacter rhaeticus AF1]|nr:hypothetical protein GLUCORHAEAF1_13290 [Komagataeibacter rhaeticus AF1]
MMDGLTFHLWKRLVHRSHGQRKITVAFADRPIHDRADSLSNATCSFLLWQPDGRNYLPDVVTIKISYGNVSDDRKGVAFKGRQPLPAMLPVFPCRFILCIYFQGSFTEGRNARFLTTFGYRIKPGFNLHSGLACPLTCQNQGHGLCTA